MEFRANLAMDSAPCEMGKPFFRAMSCTSTPATDSGEKPLASAPLITKAAIRTGWIRDSYARPMAAWASSATAQYREATRQARVERILNYFFRAFLMRSPA